MFIFSFYDLFIVPGLTITQQFEPPQQHWQHGWQRWLDPRTPHLRPPAPSKGPPWPKQEAPAVRRPSLQPQQKRCELNFRRSSTSRLLLQHFWRSCPLLSPALDPQPTRRRAQKSRQAEEEEKEEGEAALSRRGTIGSRAPAPRLLQRANNQGGAWGRDQHPAPPAAPPQPCPLQGGAQRGAAALGWPRPWRRRGKGGEGRGHFRKQNGVPPGEAGGVPRRRWFRRGRGHHGRFRYVEADLAQQLKVDSRLFSAQVCALCPQMTTPGTWWRVSAWSPSPAEPWSSATSVTPGSTSRAPKSARATCRRRTSARGAGRPTASRTAAAPTVRARSPANTRWTDQQAEHWRLWPLPFRTVPSSNSGLALVLVFSRELVFSSMTRVWTSLWPC